MKITTLTLDDIPDIRVMQPPEWGDIIPHINFYLESVFCFPVKIEMDGKTVGIGTTILHADTAWLAHIIVHPAYRRMGLGQHITMALVDSIDRTKYKTIYLIATDLGTPVYEKIGFETEMNYSVFKDGNTKFDIHHDIRKSGPNDLDQILKMDIKASGENRRQFISKHLNDAYVFKNNDVISGFYLPTLSDGPVFAENNEAGIELMKLRLQTNPVAILPDGNETALAFLHNNEFRILKKARRMRLGKQRTWHPEYYFNRISGQVG